MLKGLELFKALQNGDRVIYRGKMYTVQSVQYDYDFSIMASEGGPKANCYAAELLGEHYYYLKNLPNDPTLPIIKALEPIVKFDPLVGMAFGL